MAASEFFSALLLWPEMFRVVLGFSLTCLDENVDSGSRIICEHGPESNPVVLCREVPNYLRLHWELPAGPYMGIIS